MNAIDRFDIILIQIRSNLHTIDALEKMSSGYINFDDFLRAQIVSIVSALDYYIHEKVRQEMLEIAIGSRAPGARFYSFSLTMQESIEHNNSVDSSWLDPVIKARHSWLSFQEPEKIKDAIGYIYSGHLWQEVGRKMSMAQDDVKIELKIIVDRRNKIAHEADFDPSVPGKRWAINRNDVDKVMNFIELLVRSIDTIVS